MSSHSLSDGPFTPAGRDTPSDDAHPRKRSSRIRQSGRERGEKVDAIDHARLESGADNQGSSIGTRPRGQGSETGRRKEDTLIVPAHESALYATSLI
jgi:hypothetical protein